MEERLKGYLKIMECVTEELEREESSGKPGTEADRYERIQREKQELLIQIGFFQHERLVHLIVTVLFALLTIIVFVLAVTKFSLWSGMLLFFLLVLLLPYIRHYYILENGTQKLYQYYDRLEAAAKRRAKGVNNQGICDTSGYSILKKEYEEAGKEESIVKQIHDRETKQNIAGIILTALPDWFGIPQAREEYIKKSADRLFFSAFREGEPVGFLCMEETGKDTVELAVMGVLKQYHRQGIGTKLFQAARAYALQKGYSFLQVKTVQMGHYDDYDRTNLFYQSLGFQEFEVFPTLWDEANPCQVYVMKVER